MGKQNQEIKYILIQQENGVILKKRILTMYELEKFNKDYVIFYDDEDGEIENLYVASYDKNTEFKNLDANLSDEEMMYAREIIETVKGGLQ